MLNYEPSKVWQYFEEITRIPHCSGNEGEIRKWIVNLANSYNFKSIVDHYGNIKIMKEATKGCKNSKGIILQGHLDMVCEPSKSIKFPLELMVEDGWVKAGGTTLGGDNGIGIAMALAILTTDDIKHPPLEVLFTVEEEINLTGATNMKPGFLTYKRLINVDSEDDTKITVGGAGGGNSLIKLPIKWDKELQGRAAIIINVTGLKGGHSGINIHERPNAIKFLGELLKNINKIPALQLIDIKGGTLDNVIPSDAKAWILLNKEDMDVVKKFVDEYLNKWRNEWGQKEPNLNILMNETKLPDIFLSKDCSDRIINMLCALPSGVLEWSKDFENVVKTSTNLAIIRIVKDTFELVQSSRSLDINEIDKVRNNIRKIAEKNGATCTDDEGYPAWKPNPNSELLKLAKEVYKNMFGSFPIVEVIHGGLETGAIINSHPGMDMISIGATLENAHSTGERLNIKSVQRTYNYLLKILEAAC